MNCMRRISQLEFQQARSFARYGQLCRRSFSTSYFLRAPVSQAASNEVEAARNYCSNLLQKYDRPSYTLKAFIPPIAGDFYLAVRALNVSLSMIPDVTSAPTIGLMRLQFWRDSITKALAGTPPKEPVSLLLSQALDDLARRSNWTAGVNRGWLMRLINAREQYLMNTSYTSLEAVEQYAENTYSTLLYLTLSAYPLTSVTADHLASHIGKAAGICTVLRGVPMVAFPQHGGRQGQGAGGSRQGTIMLPLDVMAEAGVREEDVFRFGAEANGLRDAVFTVATRASDHLITARQMLKNLGEGKDVGHEFEHQEEEGHDHAVAKHADANRRYAQQLKEVHRGFGVMMPAIPASMWLDKLQAVDFDIFNPKLRISHWSLPWKAFWAYQRKRLE